MSFITPHPLSTISVAAWALLARQYIEFRQAAVKADKMRAISRSKREHRDVRRGSENIEAHL